jgi:hypothetical protein
LDLTIGSAVGPPANFVYIPVSLRHDGSAFTLDHTLSHTAGAFALLVERCRLESGSGVKRFTASLLPRDGSPGRTNLHTVIEEIGVRVGRNDPLADGLVYGCVLRVANDTPPGDYPVRTVSAALHDRDGNALEPLTAHDAVITVTDPASSTGCLMDCNNDNRVTVDEVVLGIEIALGKSRGGLKRCPLADATGDGLITIDELITAIRAMLYGCYMSVPVER